MKAWLVCEYHKDYLLTEADYAYRKDLGTVFKKELLVNALTDPELKAMRDDIIRKAWDEARFVTLHSDRSEKTIGVAKGQLSGIEMFQEWSHETADDYILSLDAKEGGSE